jgi:hypothetical protein
MRAPWPRVAANQPWPRLSADDPRPATQHLGTIEADLLVPADAPLAARLVTTRAGVTIGIAHLPRPPAAGEHGERLQSALLEPRTARDTGPAHPVTRALRAVAVAFWRWL